MNAILKFNTLAADDDCIPFSSVVLFVNHKSVTD